MLGYFIKFAYLFLIFSALILAGAIIYADRDDMIPASDLLIALYLGLMFTFTAGVVVGATVAWIAGRKNSDAAMRAHGGQSGNVFFMLFGAVALVGVIGTASMTIVRGPVAGMQKVTKYTVAENDMIAASMLISNHSLLREDADCDGDGMIEPVGFAAGAVATPAGGGIIPSDIGAAKADPWGGAYGYCAWDHGQKIKDAACGGNDANRLRGGDTEQGITVAIVSAGPDRIFQSGCVDWIDDATPVVDKSTGSDDIVRAVPYGTFLLPQSAQARLKDLPEEACTEHTTGTMRMVMGIVQVCMDTGWTEVGSAAMSDMDFIPVTNAPPGSEHTSNAISFSGFLKTKQLTLTEGSAVLIVNGVDSGSGATIEAGDTIALRATAAALPETTLTYRISVGGVSKVWTIRTQNRTPANLEIAPPPAPNMLVDGVSGTAYSDGVTYTVRNLGEDKAILFTPTVSGSSNFEITATNCDGATLILNATCSITVRAKASATGMLSGTLTVSGAAEYYGGNVSETASLSGDALFPVTLSSAMGVDLSTLSEFTVNGRWTDNRPKRVIVPAGIVVGSMSSGVPAMRTGTGRGGTLHITVNGEIQGAGGQPNSGVGGTALFAEQSGLTLVNNGAIRAGGGGGGRGGNGGAGYYASTINPYGTYPNDRFLSQNQNGSVGTFYIGGVSQGSGTNPRTIGGYTYTATAHAGGANYLISQSVSAVTNGGVAGNGGRGQGFDGAATNGAAAVAGGTNAGASGKSGDGGGWGQTGQTGANGAAGNNGSGTAGLAGGLAGFAIQNYGSVVYSGSGALQGRT